MTARIAAVLALLAFAVPAVAQDRIGTSRADAANANGAFVLTNSTGATLNYQVRWGGVRWSRHTLAPGESRTHSHPLTSRGTAPAAEVRFDSVGGDRRTRYETREVRFGRVGFDGIGPGGYVNNAVEYEFRFARDGKRLDVYRR